MLGLSLGLLVFALFTNIFFQQVSTYNEETKLKQKLNCIGREKENVRSDQSS